MERENWHVDDIRHVCCWWRLEDKGLTGMQMNKYCMKEITISHAIYQEKLYANGDISSLTESVSIFLLCKIDSGG